MKVGCTVSIYSGKPKINIAKNSSCNLGTLPEGFRPSSPYGGLIPITKLGDVGYCSVSSSGNVTFVPYVDITTYDYAYLHLSYACPMM